MGSDGHQRGIEGVDLGCGLRRVGVRVWVEINIKTKPLHCSGHLLVNHIIIPYFQPTMIQIISLTTSVQV